MYHGTYCIVSRIISYRGLSVSFQPYSNWEMSVMASAHAACPGWSDGPSMISGLSVARVRSTWSRQLEKETKSSVNYTYCFSGDVDFIKDLVLGLPWVFHMGLFGTFIPCLQGFYLFNASQYLTQSDLKNSKTFFFQFAHCHWQKLPLLSIGPIGSPFKYQIILWHFVVHFEAWHRDDEIFFQNH